MILAGKTIAIFGRLSMVRKTAAGHLRAAGAKVSTHVTRGTDLVIVGAEPGAKLAEARRLGIPKSQALS